MPVLVLTQNSRDTLVKEGGTTAGGANTVQQFIRAACLMSYRFIVLVLLGGGIWLLDHLGRMEFEITRVVDSPRVTDLRSRL